MYKILLFVFAQALVIQNISGYCIGEYSHPPCANAQVISSPCGSLSSSFANVINLAASNGGGLAVISSSPFAPNGVSIVSENTIEGPLSVSGALPFLGTVALEGSLPTLGAGSVGYSCGNSVGILSENLSGISAGSGGYGAGLSGYGAGLSGYGAGSLGYGAGLGYIGNSGYGSCGCGLGK